MYSAHFMQNTRERRLEEKDLKNDILWKETGKRMGKMNALIKNIEGKMPEVKRGTLRRK